MRSMLRGVPGRLARLMLPASVVKWLKQWRSRRRISRRFGSRRPWAFLTGSALTVLFVPELPFEEHLAFKLCTVLGHQMTSNPRRPYDVIVRHRRGTYDSSTWADELTLLLPAAINGRCTDVSKHHVQQVFRDVFGYDLAVDPTLFCGQMVEKSDENARHDGRVLRGPINPAAVRPECVYQRLIDNSSPHPGFVVDHRVPVYGDRIPLVYLKHRPIEERFANENAFVELVEPESVMSRDEHSKLLAMAKALEIDFGELDVLRDRDGRLYVVDAAKTPGGPPNGLPDDVAKIAVGRLADAFDLFVAGWTEDGDADRAT